MSAVDLVRLELARFGGFTDRVLELLPAGVNVVYGANERGKTTTMHAVDNLLFGIPERSGHDWVHGYPDLLIRGVLRARSGEELAFCRVKRRGPSLARLDDTPLSDAELERWLHGVDRTVYRLLFWFGHLELVEGGKDLLQTEGDVGRALFSAGTGLTRLLDVMRDLDARADEIFRANAPTRRLPAAIRRFRDRTSEVRDAAVSASDVAKIEKDLAELASTQGALRARLRELHDRLGRLKRVRQARGRILDRMDRIRGVEELLSAGSLVEPSDREAFEQAVGERAAASQRLSELEPELADQEQRFSELHVDAEVLAQAQAIEGLQPSIGKLDQNDQDLPGLERRIETGEAERRQLQARLPAGLHRDEQGMPVLDDVASAAIRRLALERATLDTKLESANAEVARAKQDLDRATTKLEELPPPRDVAYLAKRVAQLREEGDLEKAARGVRASMDDLRGKIEAALRSVGVVADPVSVDGLPLPSDETVDERAERQSRASEKLRTLEVGIRDDEAALAAADRELRELLRKGQVPAPDDLAAARERRDRGWEIVRAAWLEGRRDQASEERWTGGAALDRAYEEAVRRADDVADLLRTEADAVSRRATLEKDSADLERRIVAAKSARDVALEEQRRADADWAALSQPLGLPPQGVAAFRQVLGRLRTAALESSRLREVARDLAARQDAIRSAVEEIRALVSGTGAVPPSPEASLSQVVSAAEALIEPAREDAVSRRTAEESVRSAREELERRQRDAESSTAKDAEWRSQWSKVLGPIGLAESLVPADVDGLLDTVASIRTRFRDIEELRRRARGVRDRDEKTRTAALQVAERLPGRGLSADRPTDVVISDLAALLAESRSAKVARDATVGDLERKRKEVAAQRAVRERAAARIEEVRTAYRFDREEALDEAVRRTKLVEARRAEIEEFERTLLEDHGRTIDALAQEVAEVAAGRGNEELDAMSTEVEREIEQVERELSDVTTAIGERRQQHSDIDESANAAIHAEEAQFALEEARQLAEDYVRNRLARKLLDLEIEDFREQNQGPILRRAQQIFAELTLGAYPRLETDLGPRGQPVLRARTPGGSSIGVEDLSTGAGDQLYLSLRLAALDHFVESRGALPLLLDDLFINFDDERTAAGLRTLAGLSGRTQVILFTHQRSVVELAKAHIDAANLNVLEL